MYFYSTKQLIDKLTSTLDVLEDDLQGDLPELIKCAIEELKRLDEKQSRSIEERLRKLEQEQEYEETLRMERSERC